jgi:hypothetical protein
LLGTSIAQDQKVEGRGFKTSREGNSVKTEPPMKQVKKPKSTAKKDKSVPDDGFRYIYPEEGPPLRFRF